MLNKNFLVAGAGKSGIGAIRLLLRNGIKPCLFDENKKNEINKDYLYQQIKDNSVDIFLGEFHTNILKNIDILVLSPGIPTDSNFVKKAKEKNIKIIGEIELAYYFEKGKIAAITGTNGKTTTTSLVGEIIKYSNENTFIVGNIGFPYTDIADSTSEKTVSVIEVSSFQLDTIESFKPNVSAILNLTPDHLDRHYTFENYIKSKFNIAKNQNQEICVLNYDDQEILKNQEIINGQHVFFSLKTQLDKGVFVKNNSIVIKENKESSDKVVMDLSEIKILGEHNILNVLAAVAVCFYMGVSIETIRKVTSEFMGVEHRIEYVATINGVNYYNDSKGTNVDAAIKAIKAMERKTYLIGGGYDKAADYTDWIKSFDGKVIELLLIGQTKDKIASCATELGFKNIVKFEKLEEAVDYCKKNGKAGQAVLLSPACASWGMFNNFEERGNIFKKLVKEI